MVFNQSCCETEIVQGLDLDQSTVSRDIKALRIAINLSVCEWIHTITATIGMYKDFNTRLTKLQESGAIKSKK